jgi:hypothetical protein
MFFLKLFLKQLPLHKQVNFLKKKGIMLGTRIKEGRKIYIYMFRDLFAEILYKNDNPEESAESLKMVTGLENLNNHLENEFRTSF